VANRSRLVKSQLRDEAATRHGCEEKSSKDLFPSKKKCCAGPFSLKYTGKNSFSCTFVLVSSWGRGFLLAAATVDAVAEHEVATNLRGRATCPSVLFCSPVCGSQQGRHDQRTFDCAGFPSESTGHSQPRIPKANPSHRSKLQIFTTNNTTPALFKFCKKI